MNENDRRITVKCDFADKVSRLLTQVSDLYGEFWSCFNFRENDDDEFVIIVKSEPTYSWYVDETSKFLAMSDEDICNYIKETVFDLMDRYANILQSSYSKRVLNTLRDCMNDWDVTHMEMFNGNFTPIKEALTARGFTLYDSGEPCYIAKLGKNSYITVSNDFLTTQVWHVGRDITDDEFVKIVTGKDDAAFDKLYCDTYIVIVSLAYALGFRGVDPDIKFS